MDDATEVNMNLERNFLESEILKDALQENPSLAKVEEPKVKSLIRGTLLEIDHLEQAAKQPNLPKTSDQARKIKVIWCFSGPGTYDLPFKEDRYKDKPWARFMDRRRLNYSAWLMKRITEITLGRSLDGIKDPQGMKAAIYGFGPYLIYNGTADENETVRNVLTRQGVAISKEKVHIIDAGIDRTFDQIRSFSLPPGLELTDGDKIALVSHSPHLIRILHMLNKVKSLPQSAKVQVFPIIAPTEGQQEYAQMEVRGLLYSAFISGEAEQTVYPYLL